MKAYAIGIAGGSGSGKTTLAQALLKHCGQGSCSLLALDNYYIDQSARFDGDGGSVNFDHPSSLDFALLAQHIAHLKAGRGIEVPQYEFATHRRRRETTPLAPRPLIVVDGTLLFSQPAILEVLDACVFVDTPERDRFSRRLKRDVEERGRTPEGVEKQFRLQVKPMHDLYIEANKGEADLTVSGLEPIPESLARITAFLKTRCEGVKL